MTARHMTYSLVVTFVGVFSSAVHIPHAAAHENTFGRMMEQIFLIVFLVAVLAGGLWCVIAPEGVVRFRNRMGWSTGYWSGGFAYATPRRARFTGSLLVAIVLFAAAAKLLGR